jgi:hypothetical protein
VNSSNIFRWSLVVVLLTSISWKIAVSSDNADSPKDNLVDFLKRNHFEVSVKDQAVNYLPVVRAKTASCTLQIVRLAPNGSDRDLFNHLAVGTDRAFVVFRGKIYKQQPVWWTVLEDIWYRHLRELGLSNRVTAVIAVTANSSCEAERLPWDEVG